MVEEKAENEEVDDISSKDAVLKDFDKNKSKRYTISTEMPVVSIYILGGVLAVVAYFFVDSTAFAVSVGSLTALAMSIRFLKNYGKTEDILRRIDRVPVMKTDQVTEGTPAAIEGTIVSGNILKSLYAKKDCVFYHAIEETLMSRGSDDRPSWEITRNRIKAAPFYIEDEKGRVLVDLTGVDGDLSSFRIEEEKGKQRFSEIDCVNAMYEMELGTRRYSEYVLPVGQKIFAYGTVKKGNILAESKEDALIISRKTKNDYVNSFAMGSSIYFGVRTLGIFLAMGVYWALNAIWNFPEIGFYLIAGTGLFYLIYTMYNRIITLKNRMEHALHNIDVELKLRHDLIPMIETLVKEYSLYEKELLVGLTKIRSLMKEENKFKEAKEYLEAAKNLMALSEKYPELKSSGHFIKLQSKISLTENKIAASRSFYNKTVLKYNNLIEQVPFNLIALLKSFKKEEYLMLS